MAQVFPNGQKYEGQWANGMRLAPELAACCFEVMKLNLGGPGPLKLDRDYIVVTWGFYGD